MRVMHHGSRVVDLEGLGFVHRHLVRTRVSTGVGGIVVIEGSRIEVSGLWDRGVAKITRWSGDVLLIVVVNLRDACRTKVRLWRSRGGVACTYMTKKVSAMQLQKFGSRKSQVLIPFNGGHSCKFVLLASRYLPSADRTAVTICMISHMLLREATYYQK
jgi:hypothetical protein